MWPFNTGDCLIEVTSWAGLILMRIFKPMKIFEAKEKNPLVGLSNNSYKPFTNTVWVRARLCKLQKRVHLTHSRK
jgi:hypothetical protein